MSRAAVLPDTDEITAREAAAKKFRGLMSLLVAIPVSCCAEACAACGTAVRLAVSFHVHPVSCELCCKTAVRQVTDLRSQGRLNDVLHWRHRLARSLSLSDGVED